MSSEPTKSPRAGIVLVDSQALRLSQAITAYQTWQMSWLIEGLAAKGFDDLSPTHIVFISALDCDDNMASEVARRLDLSRQAVHKTVRELSGLGYIDTAPNPEKRNSKVIQITEQGERLIAIARHMFADLDQHLRADSEGDDIDKLIALLTAKANAPL